MEVNALLVDAVDEANGKLYVHGGGWSVWWAETVPAVLPRLGIAAVVAVPYTATNEAHPFSVHLLDEDGTLMALGETADGPVHRIQGEFNVGRPPELPPGDEQPVPIAVNLGGIVLPAVGRYSFVIEVDGVEEARLPFRVLLRPR
jgi:hypothetical protein